MSDVIELRGPNGETAYQCTKCKRLGLYRFTVDQCCAVRHCDECGTQYAERSYTCEPCHAKKRKANARSKWAKATPIDASTHDGHIFVEDERGNEVGDRDGWFYDLSNLAEWLDDEGRELAGLHVYASTEHRMLFDEDAVIEHALSESFDGADSHVGYSARSELKSFLDTWACKHSPTWYEVDYTRKIVVAE